MFKRTVRLYLEDLITSLLKIEDYTQGFSFESFDKDFKTIDAVVRNLEIIGEAARNIPEEFVESHTNIPCQEMIGMRNKVIHEYFGVDTEILWKTIKDDLPGLKKQITVLLKTLQ